MKNKTKNKIETPRLVIDHYGTAVLVMNPDTKRITIRFDYDDTYASYYFCLGAGYLDCPYVFETEVKNAE